jgi:hypothetical protein
MKIFDEIVTFFEDCNSQGLLGGAAAAAGGNAPRKGRAPPSAKAKQMAANSANSEKAADLLIENLAKFIEKRQKQQRTGFMSKSTSKKGIVQALQTSVMRQRAQQTIRVQVQATLAKATMTTVVAAEEADEDSAAASPRDNQENKGPQLPSPPPAASGGVAARRLQGTKALLAEAAPLGAAPLPSARLPPPAPPPPSGSGPSSGPGSPDFRPPPLGVAPRMPQFFAGAGPVPESAEDVDGVRAAQQQAQAQTAAATGSTAVVPVPGIAGLGAPPPAPAQSVAQAAHDAVQVSNHTIEKLQNVTFNELHCRRRYPHCRLPARRRRSCPSPSVPLRLRLSLPQPLPAVLAVPQKRTRALQHAPMAQPRLQPPRQLTQPRDLLPPPSMSTKRSKNGWQILSAPRASSRS